MMSDRDATQHRTLVHILSPYHPGIELRVCSYLNDDHADPCGTMRSERVTEKNINIYCKMGE